MMANSLRLRYESMPESAPSPYPDEALRERLEAQRARQAARTAAPRHARSEDPNNTSPTPARGGRKLSTRWQRWMRWLHVYASMIAFLVILFFGVTGILLNHPSWIYGDEVVTTVLEGTLPDSVVADDGRVEFLAVSEFMRAEHGVGGEVTNFDQVGAEGSINYTGPGYGASVRFDIESLSYTTTVREEGFVNAMRDLHTGSDTGSAWSWTIDIAAAFLVFVAITGLGIQLLMKKRRGSALLWLAGGTVLTALLIWFTMV